MFEKIKSLFVKKEVTIEEPLAPPPLSPKDEATKNGEPYVTIVSLELDTADIGAGSFELDFNDIFVARLIKAGYTGKTDADIVDQWFTNLCRHVVMETYQQYEADPVVRMNHQNFR
jgi:hypothetical protein